MSVLFSPVLSSRHTVLSLLHSVGLGLGLKWVPGFGEASGLISFIGLVISESKSVVVFSGVGLLWSFETSLNFGLLSKGRVHS